MEQIKEEITTKQPQKRVCIQEVGQTKDSYLKLVKLQKESQRVVDKEEKRGRRGNTFAKGVANKANKGPNISSSHYIRACKRYACFEYHNTFFSSHISLITTPYHQ